MKKRIMGLLLVVAMIATQVTMLPVFADVADGNVIKTIDDLWTAVDSTSTVISSSSATLDYKSGEGDAYIDYENGTDGNVVVKLGKEATDSAEATKTGSLYYVGLDAVESRKQKWEAKVKIANPAESSVYLMAYSDSSTGCAENQYVGDGTKGVAGPAILFEGGCVKLKELTKTSNGATGNYTAMELNKTIAADTWYRVVRYIDFTEYDSTYSTSEKNTGINRQRVLIYEIDATTGAETLIGDSEDENTLSGDWMWSGRLKSMSDIDSSKYAINSFVFNAKSATGDVMIDDIAAYAISESDPAMTCTPSWSISSEIDGASLFADSNTVTNSTSAGSLGYVNKIADEDYNWYFSKYDSASKAYVDTETNESSNSVIMLGTKENEYAPGIISNRAMYVENGPADSDAHYTKIQKWETKIKFADLTNTEAYIFCYSTNSMAIQDSWSTGTGTSASAIKVLNGAVQVAAIDGSSKTYNDAIYNGSSVTLSPNVWYRVVRYMDISESGKNKTRIKIYKVDTDGETMIYDSGDEYIQANKRSAGNLYTTNPSVVSTYVSKASGRVMIDDMKGCYVDVASSRYSIDGGTDIPVEIPDREITFNSSMDSATYDDSKITLTSKGKTVEFDDVTFADNKITLDFPTLEYNTDYTLTISKDILKDEFNRTLTAGVVYSFTTAKIVDVSSPSLVDGNGEALATLPAQGTEVKGVATLINPNDAVGNYLIIVACYNGDEFLGAICEPGTISNTSSVGTTITTADALTVPANCTKIATMVWDGWSTVKPLVQKFTLGE